MAIHFQCLKVEEDGRSAVGRTAGADEGFQEMQASTLNGPPKAKVTLPTDCSGKANL